MFCRGMRISICTEASPGRERTSVRSKLPGLPGERRTMRELAGDPFYSLIRRYDRCIIEYCLMVDDAPYQGLLSHKTAIEFAIRKAGEESWEDQPLAKERRRKEASKLLLPWTCDLEKARAVPKDASSFLFVPEILRKERWGNTVYGSNWDNDNTGGPIPYWYAFLEPPHGSGYTPEDLRLVNSALFPAGPDALEVYEWTTDWSDYFEDGHEWWGAACWSVYDKQLLRFVTLLASATD